MRIKKGDRVRVMAGNDRGKEGVVLKVIPETNRVIVEKVNMIKRHTAPARSIRRAGSSRRRRRSTSPT